MSERACKIRVETAHRLRERRAVKKPSLQQMSVTLENWWQWQWPVRRQALAVPVTTGHTNTVWLEHSSARSAVRGSAPSFIHTVVDPSCTRPKCAPHLSITSAWPCTHWTSWQPSPPASNPQREHACPYSAFEKKKTILNRSAGQAALS